MITGRRACSNCLGEINNKYTKRKKKKKRLQFLKRTEWILQKILKKKQQKTLFFKALTLLNDANKSGMSGYESGSTSKVVQRPYSSVQKSGLYAIFMVLLDFSEALNIIRFSICRSCFIYRSCWTYIW